MFMPPLVMHVIDYLDLLNINKEAWEQGYNDCGDKSK